MRRWSDTGSTLDLILHFVMDALKPVTVIHFAISALLQDAISVTKNGGYYKTRQLLQ